MTARWPAELERHIRRVCGPEDESDLEVNGDPDSLTGEEDESGYDEEYGWEDPDDFEEDDDVEEVAC